MPSCARTCGWNCSTNSLRASACASSLSVTSAAYAALATAGSKNCTFARPCDLAEYIAVSACLMSSSDVCPSPGKIATPSDGVTEIVRPSASTGASMTVSSCAATSATWRRDSMPGSSTMNSSPPKRATRSVGAQVGGDAIGQRLQQRVADQVAERIVDALEVVEVDEQQRQRLAVLARRRHQALELLVEAQRGWAGRSASRGAPCSGCAPARHGGRGCRARWSCAAARRCASSCAR